MTKSDEFYTIGIIDHNGDSSVYIADDRGLYAHLLSGIDVREHERCKGAYSLSFNTPKRVLADALNTEQACTVEGMDTYYLLNAVESKSGSKRRNLLLFSGKLTRPGFVCLCGDSDYVSDTRSMRVVASYAVRKDMLSIAMDDIDRKVWE